MILRITAITTYCNVIQRGHAHSTSDIRTAPTPEAFEALVLTPYLILLEDHRPLPPVGNR